MSKTIPQSNSCPMILCVIIILLAIIASIWGIYWKQWDWMREFTTLVISHSLYVCLAVFVSIIAIFLVIFSAETRAFPWAWGILVSALGIFWTYAGLENFQWQTLYSVIFCFALSALIFFPIIRFKKTVKWDYEPDTIGRRMFYLRSVQGICKRFNSNKIHSLSIAVYGAWGSGKTHFIRHLVGKLLENKQNTEAASSFHGEFIAASVDIWRCKDIESMSTDIAIALATAITGKERTLNKWSNLFLGMMNTLHIPATPLVEHIFHHITSGIEKGQREIDSLNKSLKYPQRAAILVLDNLDRCDVPRIRALFPLIEKLKAIQGLIIICGISHNRLAEVLSSDSLNPNHFYSILQKLVDIPIPLPPIKPAYADTCLKKYLNETGLECKNLERWIQTQHLPFETPRQIQNVINSLSFLDDCYLKRFFAEENNMRLLHHTMGHISRIDTVFYYECLRILYPEALQIIALHHNPYELISLIKDNSLLPSGEYIRQSHLVIELPVEFNKVLDQYKQEPLLASILCTLKKSSEEHLTFAIKQNYLHLENFTQNECKIIINEYMNALSSHKITPSEAINKAFPGEISEQEEEPLYKCVFEYAINSHSKYLSFLESCLERDILKENGKYANWLFSPELLLKLMGANSMPNVDHSLDDVIEKVLNKTHLKYISQILNNIWAHRYDLRIANNDVIALSPILFTRIKQNKTVSHLRLELICKKYAYKICENIFSDEAERNYWLAIAYDIKQEYSHAYHLGVDDFINNQEVWSSLNLKPNENLSKLIDAIKVIKTTYHDDIQTNSVNYLPFVTLWEKLMNKFIDGLKESHVELKKLDSYPRLHNRKKEIQMDISSPFDETIAISNEYRHLLQSSKDDGLNKLRIFLNKIDLQDKNVLYNRGRKQK